MFILRVIAATFSFMCMLGDGNAKQYWIKIKYNMERSEESLFYKKLVPVKFMGKTTDYFKITFFDEITPMIYHVEPLFYEKFPYSFANKGSYDDSGNYIPRTVIYFNYTVSIDEYFEVGVKEDPKIFRGKDLSDQELDDQNHTMVVVKWTPWEWVKVAEPAVVPVAVDVSANLSVGAAVTIDLGAGSSGGPTSSKIVSNPSHGALKALSGTKVLYTPTTCFAGADNFQFKLLNENGESNTATAKITITNEVALSIVNPFSLGQNLNNINDKLIYARNDLTSITASGLLADGASAAIAIIKTGDCANDIVIRSTNGTSMAPFSSDFMTKPPSAGGGSLKIKASGLTKVGANWFGAAWVQTPVGPAPRSFDSQIAITANQDGQRSTAKIKLVPPPVLFIHGLWSDSSALDYLIGKLRREAPWKDYPALVRAVDYAGDLAFNHPASLKTLDRYTTNVIKRAQLQGIVGSRVDVVAHSMGGLLVRSYSSNPTYRSIENRSLGRFRTIVTLDTPELGSGLAKYLTNHAGDGLKSIDPDVVAAWSATCGTDYQTTMAKCLEEKNQSVTKGAIASLIPASQALKGAPSPNISGASWRAVACTNTIGAERTALGLFIPAPYRTRSQAPTLDAIVGAPNDDIVSKGSQLAFNPSVSATFSGLAHSAVLGTTLSQSVLNSSAVYTTAACWLRNPFDSSCQSLARLAAQTQGESRPKQLVPKFASDRLSISSKPFATLGHQLTLQLSAPGALRFAVTQISSQARSGYVISESDVFDASREAGAASAITIVPRVFGKVRLRVDAEFADGTYDTESTNIDVSVDDKDITDLRADPYDKSLYISRSGGGMLNPVIDVHGLDKPVDVAAFTTWRMLSVSTSPSLSITRDGDVTPLRPGLSTVEGIFLGRKFITRIAVEP